MKMSTEAFYNPDKAVQCNVFAPTLCSYYKGFIGAIDSKVIPKPKFAVTTSFACDGNLNTFRYLAQKQNLKYSNNQYVLSFCRV